MEAYVIKNKEGKYWQWLFNHEPDWEEKLYNAFLHYSKEDAEKSIISWQLEDCEVIEITIAEGDLEQENKELKERIAELEKENLDLGFQTDFIKEKGTCAFCEYLDNEVIKELKKQLAIREKALELICYYMEYKYWKKDDDIWYRKDKELYMYFIEKAKEGMK